MPIEYCMAINYDFVRTCPYKVYDLKLIDRISTQAQLTSS